MACGRLYCARCFEPVGFLMVAEQNMHHVPDQAGHASSLFLEGVGCPECEWGRKPRLTLPNRSCWQALLYGVGHLIGVPIVEDVVEAEMATQIADAIFHGRMSDFISLFFAAFALPLCLPFL